MNTRKLLFFIPPFRLKYALFWHVLLSILLFSCTAINNGEPAPDDLILICADYTNPNQTESKTGGIFTLDVNDIGSLTQLAEKPALYGFFKGHNDADSFSPNRTHLAYTDGETVKIIGFQNENEIITTKYDPTFPDMRWSNDSKTFMVVAFTKTVDVLGSKLPVPVYKYVDVTTGAESATDDAAEEFEAYNDNDSISPDGKYQVEFNDGTMKIRELKTDAIVSEIQSSKEYGVFRFISWSPDSKQLLIWIVESPPTDSNTTAQNDSAFDWQEFARGFPHFYKATLFNVNIDGTQLTQLTAQGEVEPDIIPVWLPDSSRIIYGSWLVDADGDGLAETERTYTSLILIDLIQNVSKEVLNDSYNVTCVDW